MAEFLLVYCLEFTEQALICLDLVEIMVPGNHVKAITGGRTTEDDVAQRTKKMLGIPLSRLVIL